MAKASKPAQDAEVKQASKPAQDAPLAVSSKKAYQEWKVELKDGKAEKLKIVREKVKITEEQAAILNDGVLKGGNNIGNMYYLPE